MGRRKVPLADPDLSPAEELERTQLRTRWKDALRSLVLGPSRESERPRQRRTKTLADKGPLPRRGNGIAQSGERQAPKGVR